MMGARALASSLQAGEIDFGLMGITVFFFMAAGDLLAGVMGDTTPAIGINQPIFLMKSTKSGV